MNSFENLELNYLNWTKWVKQVNNFICAQGIDITQSNARCKAILLHYAGTKINEIFDTLSEDGDDHQVTIDKISAYLKPRKNVAFDRYNFREIAQNQGELMKDYIIRLRLAGATCEFNEYSLDEAIIEQVLSKCNSLALRKSLLDLGSGKKLTIDSVSDTAAIREQTEKQLSKMSSDRQAPDTDDSAYYGGPPPNRSSTSTQKHLSRVTSKPSFNKRNPNEENCYRCGQRCGFKKYKKWDDCPATGQTCSICKKMNHYSTVCKSKSSSNNVMESNNGQAEFSGSVHSLYEHDFTFNCSNSLSPKLCNIDVGIENYKISFIADTGSTVNIIDGNTYRQLLPSSKFPLTDTSKKIYPFSGTAPLDIVGCFQARAKFGKTVQILLIYVVNSEHSGCLLSKQALEDLGIVTFNLTAPERCNLSTDYNSLFDKYPEVTTGVGRLKDTKLKLHIDPSIKPVVQPTRKVPFHDREKVEAKLHELEDLDLIEKVTSPTSWLSPIHIVPKKQGDIRVVIDMRRANEAIQRTRRPIPMVEDVIYELNGATVFSTLDLNMGYHQIELDEESRDITTFTTHIGTYRFKTLVMGVSSATEEFQHLIAQSLSDCKGCKNISDDIVVFGKTQAEHDENLGKVLRTLAEKGLTLNKDKCKIGLNEVEFFGFRISSKGIQPKHDNIQAVKQLTSPTSVSEVRSFLGMANMMSRFIENYSDLIGPLTALTKKNVQFHWGPKEEKAFNAIKDAISSDKLLAHFDISKPTHVYTDASPVGLGASLLQEGKAVIYVSRLLTDAETRYCQTEREALGIVWACERLHIYLHGNTFTLHTDHKPLLTLYGRTGDPSARILRWALRMQQYHYTVSYIKGADNPVDYLSRHPHEKAPAARGIAEEFVNFTLTNAIPTAMGVSEVIEHSTNDAELTEVREAISSGDWNTLRNTSYYNVRNQLTQKAGLLLRDSQIVIPSTLRQRCLRLAHGGHLGISKSKTILRSKVWWPGLEKDIESYIKACPACQSADPGGAERLEPLLMSKPPELPFSTIHVDICGPWPSGDFIITLIDQTTRYPTSTIVKSTYAYNVIDFLHSSFTTFGFPATIVSDNGSQFTSGEFQDYCQRYNIKHRPVTPLHPRANGEVERFFRTTKKVVRCAILEGKDWKTEYDTFLFNYRDAKHATTGKSPAELIFGYELRGSLPSMRTFNNQINAQKTQDALKKDKIQKEKIKGYADKDNKAKASSIEVGDMVLLKQKPKNKFDTPYNPRPFTVLKRHGNQLTIKNEKSKFRRNVSQVKIFNTAAEQTPSTPTLSPPSPTTFPRPVTMPQTNTWTPLPLILTSNTLKENTQLPEELPHDQPLQAGPPEEQGRRGGNDKEQNILEDCVQRILLAEINLNDLDQIEKAAALADTHPELEELLQFYHTDDNITLDDTHLQELEQIEIAEQHANPDPQIAHIFSLYQNEDIISPIPSPLTDKTSSRASSSSSTPNSSPSSTPNASPLPSSPERQSYNTSGRSPPLTFIVRTCGNLNPPRRAKHDITYFHDSDNSLLSDNTDSDKSFKPE